MDEDVNTRIGNQLREDADFLNMHGLMDYSVLVGITNVQLLLGDIYGYTFPE